jgi:hypothetical protein
VLQVEEAPQQVVARADAALDVLSHSHNLEIGNLLRSQHPLETFASMPSGSYWSPNRETTHNLHWHARQCTLRPRFIL